MSGTGNRTVAIEQAGKINLSATLTETDNYLAASKTMILTINKATPAINFTDVTVVFGGDPYDLNATSYTGANIEYSVFNDGGSSTGEISLSGSRNQTLTAIHAGSVQVTATLTESVNYKFGSKTVTVNILKASQVITVPPVEDVLSTDGPLTIAAVASSSLPVTLTLKSGPASLSGKTATLTGEGGLVTIEASQNGNGDYAAAEKVTVSFEVLVVTGIGETSGGGIKIWPNPVQRQLNISSDDSPVRSLQLIDQTGRTLLLKTPFQKEVSVQLPPVARGIYILALTMQNGKTIFRRIQLVND